MITSSVQLSLLASPAESMQGFVPHSGVSESYETLRRLLDDACANHQLFQLIFLCGPQGTGKSYLLRAAVHELERRDYPSNRVSIFDVNDKKDGGEAEEWVASFVARYEELRREGGFMIVSSTYPPAELSSNPHLRSRLLAGVVLELRYPEESELRPLVAALLEQRNMRVSDRTLDYLLQRLPADPLSLASIFDRINQYSLQESRPARLGLVRKVISSELL